MSYLRGKNRWISYYDAQGRQIRESVGAISKKAADLLEAKQKIAITESKHLDLKQCANWTLSQMIDDWHPFARIQKDSWRADVYRAKTLLRYFGNVRLESITVSLVKGFQKRRRETRKESTVNREVALLKAMFSRLVADGRYPKNPIEGLALLPEDHLKRDRILTAAEEADLWKVVQKDPYLFSIITVEDGSGMRAQELLGLEWSRVRLWTANGAPCADIRLGIKDSKNEYARTFPVTTDAARALHERYTMRNGPFVFHINGKRVNSIRKRFQTALRKAGVENFRLHDWRHVFITKMYAAGVPKEAIKQVTGHKTDIAFRRYINLSTEQVRQLINNHNLSTKTVTQNPHEP